MAFRCRTRDPSGVPCHWCLRPMHRSRTRRDGLQATKDHITPQHFMRNGMSAQGANVVWACRACNELKGCIAPAEWERITFRFPDWWTWWAPKGVRRLSVIDLDARWQAYMRRTHDGNEA